MKRLALIALLGCALPAFADRMPLPANTPASFKNECGSCHFAYPPALLAAKDWQRTMAGLKDHFGTEATVDAKTGLEIAAFLERNAGNPDKLGTAGEPPRITQTARFVRKHREVSAKTWRDPRIKSAANCEACHRGAANGSFSEHEITMPSGLR
ncbi:MAG: diheme cytochrome c [Dechloromonas sp.]|uniref:Diheme cytochrome c n=1 Tax=Candidatus Dechloromonas phosphorivorans TaxID=2899244 RepID=A0A935K9W7_9RHOO|nr:diheme cytochrome c [Candidatus Dechloromonas phosphorivorans]